MCGIAGVVNTASPPDPVVADRIADALTHRGPDDHGRWHDDRAALAHRRLAVIDPGPAGRQPMATGDGRFVLVYNGELYNEPQLRAELEADGVAFRTACDTETLLHTLARHALRGDVRGARPRLRGMYAFGFYDTREGTLLLGRDELGVKPLYYAKPTPRELVFASEPAALFALPGLAPRPDPDAVSAYLATIQVTIGTRTLFEGVSTLPPGVWLIADLTADEIVLRSHEPSWDAEPANAASTRDAIAESVRLQLRADVPTCCLLSGGLDSSVISALALDHLPDLNTYCAGSRDPSATSEDFEHARAVAERIGARHTEAPVSRDLFQYRWPEMVHATGLPLCTPNEVAINEVARTLRADGRVVTLSGEGADEVFGGYALPLMMAHEHIAANPRGSDAAHALATITWVHPDQRAAVLNAPPAHDLLAEWFASVHAETRAAVDADFPETPEADRRLHTILRMQRRVNLPNLLRRLDQATMLASVEGRTPFADRVVARHAETLPLGRRFVPHADPGRVGPKLVLREAFADRLPRAVVHRPKASFPLPFEGWLDAALPALDTAFASEMFTPDARSLIAADPSALWTIAWPVLNLALWGERWWGR